MSVKFAGYATTAGIATNLGGGTAGQVPYQTDANKTSFTQVGTANSLLQSNGTGAPTWVSPLGLFVQNAGYATTAGIATYATNAGVATYATKAGLSTNLVSIAATGQIPYQSADNTTSFTSGGLGGNLLQYNGLSGPIWASPQGLTIGYALTAGIATYATYATKAGISTYATDAGIATNLKGISGNIGQVPWQSGISTTTFTTSGVSGSSLLQYGGISGPTWVSPADLTAKNAGYADNAGIATNIKDGSAGQIVYQTGASATNFVQVGAAGSILVGNGTNGPTWKNPSLGFNVDIANYASNAGIATNLKSLTADRGQIPWQGLDNQTFFTTGGVSGSSLLQFGGNGGPTWVSPADLTAKNAGYATTAGIATNLKSLTADRGQIPWQNTANQTLFTTGGTSGSSLLQFGGDTGPTWVNLSDLTATNATNATNAVNATNIKNGSAGQIVYQTGGSQTGFIPVGSAGSVLSSNGSSIPTWINPLNYKVKSAEYADNAGIATNIKDGSAGQIVYQTGASATNFVQVGAAGSILVGNGTNGPTWKNPSLGFNVDTANYAGNAGIATNIKDGSAGQIPYQIGGSQTKFIAVGTAGSVLSSNGTGMPTWINLSASGAKPIINNNDSQNLDRYLTFVQGNSGVQDLYVDSSDLKYNPSANKITVPRLYATTALGVGTDPTSFAAGEIRTTNNITAYVASDINLKTNIKPITEPIKKLSQINGVSFDWKDDYIAERGGEDGYFVRKHDIGVIAQEIEKVLPEIVVSRENGTKAIKYELLAPLLIEAIKEQQETIINLQRRIESLENQ